MELILLCVHVFGATMLLLYAVKLVQTGVERTIGATLRREFSGQGKSRLRSALIGTSLAVIMQSSTAVALLSASFVASGAMGFNSALAAVLGADLGSALVVQVLSFNLEWLTPLLLAIGGWLFVKRKSSRAQNVGRILLGIALLLLSLELLGEAFQPIRESNLLPALSQYLVEDFLTAFIIGAALAFIMHSSVAVILMCITVVSLSLLPVEAGISLLLGANLGGAMIPVWLLRHSNSAARHVTIANALSRGSFAIMTVFATQYYSLADIIHTAEPQQVLIYIHLLFNAVLLILCLPFINSIGKMTKVFVPNTSTADNQTFASEVSCLDDKALEQPSYALANMRREVLRMSQILTVMATSLPQLYRESSDEQVEHVRALDQRLNAALSGIRHYASSLPHNEMCKGDRRIARMYVEIAVDLELAGDIISVHMVKLARHIHKSNIRFSNDGWTELTELHTRVMENMSRAFAVVATSDVDIARQVIEEKAQIRKLEQRSRKQHFKRLRQGSNISFDSSDMHLETLRALKDLHSRVATLSYQILANDGQLMNTRLVPENFEQATQ